MAADAVECALLEVSSHALALDRVHGCAFDAAVFTNLSPEHLNFHETMEEYLAAKARLFEMLGEPSFKPWPRWRRQLGRSGRAGDPGAVPGAPVVSFGPVGRGRRLGTRRSPGTRAVLGSCWSPRAARSR